MTEAVIRAIATVDPTVPGVIVHRALDAHARAATSRSRLAEELRDHPFRLTKDDPRSSAVLARVVADLNAAGHASFVPPTCPSCGRERTYGYPSEDGVRICRRCRPAPTEACEGCGHERRVARRLHDGSALCTTCCSHDESRFEPCTTCSRRRRVAVRDSRGRPFCHPCYKRDRPDRTGRWTGSKQERRRARTAAVVKASRANVPSLTPTLIEHALDEAAPSPAGHANVANWLLDHPDALTSGDNHCPPTVLKFIDLLIAAGADIARPACGHCGRADRPLPHNTPEGRICPNCYLVKNAERCGGCGKTAGVHRRLPDGSALCQVCSKPFRLRIVCSRCGRERHRAGTVDDQPLCGTCKRHVDEFFEDCSVCGRSRTVSQRDQEGAPVCPTCAHRLRTEPCAVCGRDRPVASRVDGQPYCASCRPRKSRKCARCGEHRVCYRILVPEQDRLHGAEFTEFACGHCVARQRLRILLRGPNGTVAGHWEPLIAMLLKAPEQSALLAWVRDRTTAQVLHLLAQHDEPPTHADLDNLAAKQRHSAEQARALLEMAGLLDHQDSRRHRVTSRAKARIAADCPPEDRLVLEAYLNWSLLPAWERAARRRRQPIPSRNVSDLVVVIAYLGHLRSRGACLTSPHQAHFDAWTARNRSHILPLRRFLRWAQKNHHSVPIDIPQMRRREPREFIPDEQRRAVIARALWNPEPTWTLADRFAMLLVLLYGQSPFRITALRCEDLRILAADRVHLRLGRDPVELLPPVATLATQLQDARASTTPVHGVSSPWLFPGRSPGRALHPTTLARRLKSLGVPARASHNTTLLDLAQSAPTAVIADLLGLHPSTVESWSNASGARWASYARPQREGPNVRIDRV